MTLLVITKYLHFLAIFAVFASLTTQHLMIKESMTRSEIRRLSRIDLVYGIGAILVLVIGLILWFGVGKPAEYYTRNMHMHIKLTLFIIMGLISIYPSRFFIKQRKGDPDEVVSLPKSIVMTIRMELTLLILIPLFAVLMANGFGSF